MNPMPAHQLGRVEFVPYDKFPTGTSPAPSALELARLYDRAAEQVALLVYALRLSTPRNQLAFDARELYKKINCPALVLGARDDLVMPYWFAQDAAAAIPNSRLVIYEHGGHMFPETRTSDFLQEVNAFISCP